MKIPNDADVGICQSLAELTEAGAALESGGHGDKVLGHLSLRDPRGRGFWMKRSGISLAELNGPEDFVLVDFDGRKTAGGGVRHAEWPIHSEIFLTRPDINVIGHTHPYGAGVLATTEQPVEALTRNGAFFPGGVPRYRETSNLVITKEMGGGVARALGDAAAVLMRNHGITYGGASIADCVAAGLMCEYGCRDQRRAAASGLSFQPASGKAAAALRLAGRDVAVMWQSLRQAVSGAKPTGGQATGLAGRLATAHRVLANEGLGVLNFGMIACRDDSGRVLCGNPALALSRIYGAGDLIALDDAPKSDNAAAFLRRQFDRKTPPGAAVYSCAPATSLFSAAHAPLAPTGDEGKHFENAVLRLGPDDRNADVPETTRAVFLRNEGAVIFGDTVEVASLRAIFLERACALQLDAAATGLAWGWLPDSSDGIVGMTLEGQGQIDNFWDYYCRKLARAEAGKKLPGE